MEKKLPLLFVGSSRESLRAAQALANNLRFVAFPKPWPQIFTLSQTTIESLMKEAPTFDFAVFVLAADDVRESRKVKAPVPRDNIIFETGLFMGVLGRDRVFLVSPRDVKVVLPSDFAGITTADYVVPSTNDYKSWESSMTFASTRISDEVERLQFRSTPKTEVALSDTYMKFSEGYINDAARYIEKFIVSTYGVSARLSSLSFDVLDLQGTANIRRAVEGIKVSGPIKIDQIPGSITPGTRNGRITKHPTLVRKVKFAKPVVLKQRVKKDDLSLFDIVIRGSLTQNDPALDYEYESTLTKSFWMTKEDVEEAYRKQDFKFEYISLRLEMPTDKAMLEISFPKGYPVEIYPGVFFGDSESLHDSELNRVTKSNKAFKKTKRGARFIVNKPVVGFNYIIYWVSPTKKDLNSKGTKP